MKTLMRHSSIFDFGNFQFNSSKLLIFNTEIKQIFESHTVTRLITITNRFYSFFDPHVFATEISWPLAGFSWQEMIWTTFVIFAIDTRSETKIWNTFLINSKRSSTGLVTISGTSTEKLVSNLLFFLSIAMPFLMSSGDGK